MPNEDIAALHEMLARVIDRWTRGVSDCSTAIRNLGFFRREAPVPPAVCLIEPSVVLVSQGKKQIFVGGEAFPYDTERFLITSLDIPANSETIAASRESPCLGLALTLDLRIVAELIAQGGLPPPQDPPSGRGLVIGTLTPAILGPIKRLVDLLDEPAAIPVIAPLIQREIHYRLLMSDQAARLWQIASVGSQSHRIARAIDWLKMNYASPFRVEDLAARALMSPSTFHHHFRQLTAMSPLQYQKWLRLNEARRLMLNERRDAAEAAFHVGYESPSHFSRDYNRLFGASPKRDIKALRRNAEDPARSALAPNPHAGTAAPAPEIIAAALR
ncbi:AraC family transcriptional regulator [Methylocystis heyeri]|uniref:Helix-turn-helix domain-containing protein n=1 Tax=Methylocystis heyeri TaxID=391905 RepID=A0A6B8KF35_9HYPH|nr:AraC family transcriptional regulator [Methylocystis heyeri]QGM46906.1 helix-turn-helix domain-containing protein [Methylocystis heyeri]